MSKTLANTRNLVRSFLNEAGAADWTDAELNQLVNIYYHRIRDIIINVYEDYFITTTTFNSVANQEEYGSSDGAPTNIYKIRRVELNYDVTASSGAPTRCLPIYNMDAVRRDLGYANAGIGLKTYGNAFYYTYGFESNFKIGFIPMPANPGGSGTNAIKIWYVPLGTDMTSDSDTVNIPFSDKHYIHIVHGATADALRFGSQDLEGADVFEKKYEVGKEQMIDDIKEKLIEEPRVTVDTSGDNITFDAPY